MINTIEYVDAEAIATRNSTKKVSWKTYKRHHWRRFKKAKNDNDLKKVFYAFADGFVNGHSHFVYLYTNSPEEELSSDIKMGYTYPNISFFELESNRTIAEINGLDINEVFFNFENYSSNHSSTIGSQNGFAKSFESGKLRINGIRPKVITFSDGSQTTLTYNVSKKEDPYAKYTKALSLENYSDWKKVAIGYKAALLQKGNMALIKIKDFLYFKGRGGSIKCEEKARDSTICSDVQILKKGLEKINDAVDVLIFDLQNNPGGMENTPFLKMFSPCGFYDLRIQYKKTHLLLNDSLRSYFIDYNGKRGEAWFQDLVAKGIYDQTKDEDFLPQRADFCRGDEKCALKKIYPNGSLTSKFKKIVVLVNEGTASSADDFAFRMKSQENVLVAGQPQAADLTYALVSTIFYFDDNGEVKKMHVGNRQRDYKVPGKPILKFDIPYSKTVNEQGEMLQGNPLKLDIAIPITKINFKTREKTNLNQIASTLKTNQLP